MKEQIRQVIAEWMLAIQGIVRPIGERYQRSVKVRAVRIIKKTGFKIMPHMRPGPGENGGIALNGEVIIPDKP